MVLDSSMPSKIAKQHLRDKANNYKIFPLNTIRLFPPHVRSCKNTTHFQWILPYFLKFAWFCKSPYSNPWKNQNANQKLNFKSLSQKKKIIKKKKIRLFSGCVFKHWTTRKHKYTDGWSVFQLHWFRQWKWMDSQFQYVALRLNSFWV